MNNNLSSLMKLLFFMNVKSVLLPKKEATQPLVLARGYATAGCLCEKHTLSCACDCTGIHRYTNRREKKDCGVFGEALKNAREAILCYLEGLEKINQIKSVS